MENLAFLIATGLKTGLWRPRLWGMLRAGTYGSLFGVVLSLGALWLDAALFSGLPVLYATMCVLLDFAGRWSIPSAERRLGQTRDWKGALKYHDQNEIVIDEIVAMFVVYLPLTILSFTSWAWFGAAVFVGLVVFRIVDAMKFWPATHFDGRGGADSVMLDDYWVAFLYAMPSVGIVWLVQRYVG